MYVNKLEEMLLHSNEQAKSQLFRITSIIAAFKKEKDTDINHIKILMGYLQNGAVELDYFVHDCNDFIETIAKKEKKWVFSSEF